MQGRRRFTTGILAALTGLGFAGRASSQYYPPGYPQQGYPQQGYLPGPPRYLDDGERRRFEERRREEEFGGRPPDRERAYGMEQERNRRVLRLQQQFESGQIGRREFEGRVAEIDRELHERLEDR